MAMMKNMNYVPVPQNIAAIFSHKNDWDICVVCRDTVKTHHALIQCLHRVLCADCVPKL